MKKTSKKGFTVAELLIVVAIIAVLVGIAIPIYRHKAEKAKEAYDIHTMRQAASAAIDLYYMGIDELGHAGLNWWYLKDRNSHTNAAGAYDPGTGKFYPTRGELPVYGKSKTGYGKGTKINGGTKFSWGNTNRDAYKADEDYTKAVVMVSIYPYTDPPHVDVYWKNNAKNDTTYVGGQVTSDDPKYSIRIYLN